MLRKGKGGDLPYALSVQKWRVVEPQVVVCYHGNSGKQHDFTGKSSSKVPVFPL